ncbi:ImcF-related family protein, partial [Pseudomonas japonica]|uniref:ImcF-related family protein n=1 Tax=Pseudomonas japonica TaxID=256466 RepID=UPI003801D2EE
MTQPAETPKFSPLHTVLLLAGALALVVALAAGGWYLFAADRAQWRELLLVAGLAWTLLFIVGLLVWQISHDGVRQLVNHHPAAPPPAPKKPPTPTRTLLIRYLRDLHGPFWRRRVRLLLVVGEPGEIEGIAPGLGEQRWLVGERTVLLWGGSLRQAPDPADLALWRGLSRWRGLDGVVWALTREQSLDSDAMGVAQGGLRGLAHALRWQLPLYLWQVRAGTWSQAGRETQPVGCLLPRKADSALLEHELSELVAPLRVKGLEQMEEKMSHDFLLRLSSELRSEGIPRWGMVLRPWLDGLMRGTVLRGLYFSLALGPRTEAKLEHLWLADNAWRDLIGDRTHPRRFGWPAPRIIHASLLLLALVWGAGMALSFTSNRAQIAEMQTTLATLDQAEQGDAQLLALHELVRELARLDHRTQHGTPWYQRFGLNQNQALLDTLWPRYVEINARLLRDPAVALLQSRLDALVRLPPDSPERATRAAASYDQLKAWLMLARPEKADPAFLVRVMGELEPERPGFSPGAWHTLAPGLWQFYAEHLEAHPVVALEPRLLLQARQVLIG